MPVVLALAMTGAPCVAAEAGDAEALLRGSPLEHLSAPDIGHFDAVARQVVAGPTGRRIDWRAGDERGTLRAGAGFRRDGERCRELLGKTTSGERSDPFRITYCRAGKGSWRLAPNRPGRKSVPPTPSRAAAR